VSKKPPGYPDEHQFRQSRSHNVNDETTEQLVARLQEELREANEEVERCWADETELVQTINTLRLDNAILRGKIASMKKEQRQ
jgi:hypothetical protein